MKITSLANQKVIYWAKLKMKKYRDIEHLFIVESENLVTEAMKKGIVVEIITTDSKEIDGYQTYNVTEEIMKRLTSLVTPPKIMAVCKYIMPDDIKGNVLILERLQDPGNLGTIIRSAVAFNFETIILSPDTVDVYNDKVIRSSEGMIFNINIIKSSIPDIIPVLKKNEYYIIGTNVNAGYEVRDYKKYKCAYIIGNEGKGMSDELSGKCDGFIKLPMQKKCESLNAAVAASIIMYEVYHE